MNLKLALIGILSATSMFLGPVANAFQILSAVTNGCHENISMGAFGYGLPEFHFAFPGTALIQRFIGKVRAIGVPDNSKTRALIKEMTTRFNWQDLDLETRYVLTSLVAGARMPDTAGFSIIDINHIRGSQLTDAAQAIHTLRRIGDNGDAGDQSAITHTRDLITTTLDGILNGWASGPWEREQLWTFPFYGPHNVALFWPAFDLGQIFHSVEDAYAHTIRDTNFQIVGVANYIETMNKTADSQRDGPPHSERLDQCNMANDFDSMRITEAQRQLVRVVNELDSLLDAGTTSDATIETILDDIYDYRSGCDHSNGYCGVPWATVASEDISQPFNLTPGCGLVKGSGPQNPFGRGGGGMIALLLLVLPLAVAFKMRRGCPQP